MELPTDSPLLSDDRPGRLAWFDQGTPVIVVDATQAELESMFVKQENRRFRGNPDGGRA